MGHHTGKTDVLHCLKSLKNLILLTCCEQICLTFGYDDYKWTQT